MGTDISTISTGSLLSYLDDRPATAPAELADIREAEAARVLAETAPAREAAVPDPEADPVHEPVLPPADQPVADQAEAAGRRIDSLLARAGARMPNLNGSLFETVKKVLIRPGLFRTGHCMHTKVTEVAKACDEAAAAFGKISAAEYAKHPIPDEAFAALQKFTSAQQNFAAALQRYSEKTGTDGDNIRILIQSASNRAAEALNLAAVMQIAGMEQAPAEGEGAAVAAALAEGRIHVDPEAAAAGQILGIGTQMHGAHFSRPLHDSLAEISHQLDALEARRNLMTATEFREQAGELRDRISALRENISLIGDMPGGLGDEMAVQRDRGLQEQLGTVLGFIENRFNAMAENATTVENAVTALLPEINGDAFAAFTGAPFEALLPYTRHLPAAVSEYSQSRRGILETIGRGGLTEDRFEADLKHATGQFGGHIQQGVRVMRLLHAVATKPNLGKNSLREALNDQFGFIVSIQQAEEMAVRLKAMAKEGHPGISQAGILIGSFASARSDVVQAEVAEIAGMLANEQANAAALRADYLAAAFEHHVDGATLIGAAQRGIPADQLELSVGDASLVKDRILGQGAANAVSLCTYRTDTGEEREFVFKPEIGARHGLSGLKAHEVGYDPAVRVMQVNVAATRVADAIGCGGTVARSTIGTHRGQIGLFMERAPGRTARDFIHSGEFVDTLQAAGKAGTLSTVRANLMRELCRLEWADVLAGQVDRHGDNYLVDINPADGRVRVTGIDNDASFGTHRLGIDAYEIVKDKKLQILRIRNFKNNRKDLELFRSTFGLNQMSVPTHIDRDTYDRLMNINPQTYRDSLAGCLNQEAVQASLSRLLDAQYHARELARAGRVVTDWSNPKVMSEMIDQRRNPSAPGDVLAYTMNGFFSRDFLRFFC